MAYHQNLSKMTTAQILKGSTLQGNLGLLMKDIKSKTDLGIIKFFSLQTVYTYCERIFINIFNL